VVLSSIGQLKEIELGYFVKKGDYFPEILQETYELLGISGMITKQDGKYIPHLHAILGNIEKEAYGGHLIRGTVQTTNETILRISYIELGRTLNERTGLMDLDPS
jgi:predicted DNA-binding protein with PD1-like motif